MNNPNTKVDHLAAAYERARRALRLETLDERKSDSLDFHDLHVERIRDAIQIAFEAGYAAGRGEPVPNPAEHL